MEHFTLMRRILKFSVLCLAAGVVSACRPDEIILTEAIPTAGVRFIHAVPDTGRMDFRFVDFPENNVQWQIEFRNTPRLSAGTAAGTPGATFVQFMAAKAGSRHFTVFMNGTTAAVASDIVWDTTVTLTAGSRYTALLWGYANPAGPNRPAGAPLMRGTFIEENVTDPAANVALRVINASNATIDARYYPSAGAAPGTDIALGMAPLTMSSYVTAAPAQYRFNIDLAGTATNLFANGIDRVAMIGAPEDLAPPGPFDALPGTTQAGSAVTAIIFAPSVTGTQAPQGAGTATIPPWTDEAIVYVWDRRPPRSGGV